MKAVVQRTYGGPELIEIQDVEQPVPDSREVLVEVRAAGLSPGDRAMLTGVPLVNRLAASGVTRPRSPIPGFDVAGTVSAVGAEVTDLGVGDAVFGIAAGSFAQFAVGAREELAAIPADWSYEQAAAVPESGCVALQAVRDRGMVREGQLVAILGAGGGVGAYAVQIANSLGADVTGVCSAAMLQGVSALGANRVIDYATDGLADAGQRYDVIIDTAGKAPLRDLRSALADRGTLVIVGSDHSHRVTGGLGHWVRALFWSPFLRQRLRPFVARPLTADHLASLVELMQTGWLAPTVDRTFPLEQAADAMRHLDHRSNPGKVVVVV